MLLAVVNESAGSPAASDRSSQPGFGIYRFVSAKGADRPLGGPSKLAQVRFGSKWKSRLLLRERSSSESGMRAGRYSGERLLGRPYPAWRRKPFSLALFWGGCATAGFGACLLSTPPHPKPFSPARPAISPLSSFAGIRAPRAKVGSRLAAAGNWLPNGGGCLKPTLDPSWPTAGPLRNFTIADGSRVPTDDQDEIARERPLPYVVNLRCGPMLAPDLRGAAPPAAHPCTGQRIGRQ